MQVGVVCACVNVVHAYLSQRRVHIREKRPVDVDLCVCVCVAYTRVEMLFIG